MFAWLLLFVVSDFTIFFTRDGGEIDKLPLVNFARYLFMGVFYLAYAQSADVLERLGLPSSPAFRSRYISSFHAVALGLLGGLWQAGLAQPGWWIPLAQALPCGYLFYDAYIIVTEPTLWKKTDLVHHQAFALLVWYGATSYPDQTAWAFLAELSVPSLNLGWMMVQTGANGRWPKLFVANIAVLVIVFFELRVVTFTRFIFEAIALEAWTILPMVAILAALNWYWFVLLLMKLHSTLGRKPPM